MIILFIILGLIMGSFYMALAMRFANNESIIKPRSHCEYCNHPLSWFELIPLFSYIILGGKCYKCHHKLSIMYPLIEVLTALLFGMGYFLYGISYELWAYLIISSILIIILISDFKYFIILDSPLIIGSILIIILKFIYFGFQPCLNAILSGIALFLMMFLIKFFGDRVFKRESLGGGDVKLAIFIGVCLGIRLGLCALVIGSFIALPYATYYVIRKKEKEIPYGPFLIIATLICFIFMSPIREFIEAIFLIG